MTALSSDLAADLTATWRGARARAEGTYLDSAAAGRSSTAVVDAVVAHLRREGEVGAYGAATEAREAIDRGRADLAGLLGRAPGDLAFVDSAFGAVQALMAAWPLRPGSRVLVTAGEYGPNLALFASRGLETAFMPTADAVGHVDVDALGRRLDTDPPDLVHLCAIGSHRGIVQPAHVIVDACRARNIPVIVDAAQALGHIDCRFDADAVYATGRKWLAGPRGVGVLAVRPQRAALLLLPPGTPERLGTVAALESREAFVGGRVGLGVAVGEHLAAGPDSVRAGLRAIGRHTRERLDGVGGWEVVESRDEPSATTTLRPPPGWSDARIARAREDLRVRHRVTVTFAGPERAPAEVSRATLRVSPHLDATATDLDLLASALEIVTRGSA